MTYAIEQRYLDAMIAHAKVQYPNEACGIIAGCKGQVVKIYCLSNAEHGLTRYEIEPREQLGVLREIDARGWEMLGIFHSHTCSSAYPSQTVVELAYYPEALYFIVSLMDEDPVVRVFRIVDGNIQEESIVTQADRRIEQREIPMTADAREVIG